jgi:hypothetical protein
MRAPTEGWSAAACRLAVAEAWVRLPLGALSFRTWESLGFRVLRAHEIVGSNPTVLTEHDDAVVSVLVRKCGC